MQVLSNQNIIKILIVSLLLVLPQALRANFKVVVTNGSNSSTLSFQLMTHGSFPTPRNDLPKATPGSAAIIEYYSSGNEFGLLGEGDSFQLNFKEDEMDALPMTLNFWHGHRADYKSPIKLNFPAGSTQITKDDDGKRIQIKYSKKQFVVTRIDEWSAFPGMAGKKPKSWLPQQTTGADLLDQAARVLGVNQNDSQETVKSAYKKLSLKWHPDKNPTDKDYAGQVFKVIGAAWDTFKMIKKWQ